MRCVRANARASSLVSRGTRLSRMSSSVRGEQRLCLRCAQLGMSVVRREALRHIPGAAGMDWREVLGSDDLPGAERLTGTRACQKNRRLGPGIGNGAPGDPRDTAKAGLPEARNPLPRKEITTRLLRSICELCGTHGEVHMHYVAKLTELVPLGLHQPEWARLMATRRRKSLVVCSPCHESIHTNPDQATPITT